ncbi:hypothetical protein DOM22_05015 [Bdellovibrio sp. ZAP7]|uniref:hypothetical protein n=1 Tax=Bdellovibrio sp. ZAP7 TaxID=2231053 RepID=UPI0011598606|nr:hypothetical protein [Bdellovibrio sp. ZAP7]QDK44565.1 hypothetical protein DOM22_05015 [Bdellovibrio sp. ZAP7]
MKTIWIFALLITLTGIKSFAEETPQQNINAKPSVTYEQTMKNYANKTKEVKKDLDKASQERQKQMNDLDKVDADSK